MASEGFLSGHRTFAHASLPCIFPSTSLASLASLVGCLLFMPQRSLLNQEPLLYSDVLTGTWPPWDFLWLHLFPSLAGRSVRLQAPCDLLTTPALCQPQSSKYIYSPHIVGLLSPPGRAHTGGGSTGSNSTREDLFPSQQSVTSRVIT